MTSTHDPEGPRWRELAPAWDTDGPRVRLGLLWAAATLFAVAFSTALTAAVFAMVAMAAAGQAAQTWRVPARQRPLRVVAVTGALGLPIVATLGPVAVGLAAVIVAATSFLLAWLPDRFGSVAVGPFDPRPTVAIALVTGLAAAAPVVVRDRLGVTPALVLVAVALAYDATAFIVGTGATRRWEATVASAASIGAVSLVVAAVFVPPFRGASPWLLGLVAAVTAPLGPYAASVLVAPTRNSSNGGGVSRRVPALRRLDSLILLGPVWGVVAAGLLDVSVR